MALGNNTGKGTARHKGQIKQSIKERRDAKNYTAFQGSAVQGSLACSVSNGDVNITYYHTQALADFPMLAGTKVYTKKRAHRRYYPANGHIKMGPDRGRYYNIEIVDGALRINATTCP